MGPRYGRKWDTYICKLFEFNSKKIWIQLGHIWAELKQLKLPSEPTLSTIIQFQVAPSLIKFVIYNISNISKLSYHFILNIIYSKPEPIIFLLVSFYRHSSTPLELPHQKLSSCSQNHISFLSHVTSSPRLVSFSQNHLHQAFFVVNVSPTIIANYPQL